MNRVNTYPITNEAKTREPNIVQDILHNNEHNKSVSIIHSEQQKHKSATPENKMGYFYV
jgi:hypothetical protein